MTSQVCRHQPGLHRELETRAAAEAQRTTELAERIKVSEEQSRRALGKTLRPKQLEAQASCLRQSRAGRPR